jgi:dihydrofolate reductase
MISLIAAMSKNRAIGKDNKIPWHLSEDLKRFRQLTVGKCIVMGKNTFDSIGKALPKRINVVVSRTMDIPETNNNETPPSLLVFRDLKSAIDACITWINHFKLPDEIMICGGSQIYTQTIDSCDRMYLTILEEEYEGDTFFPNFNEEDWEVVSEEKHDGYRYVTYDRIVK